MNLGAFVAERRRRILDELLAGRPPSEGEFSDALLKEGRVKGQPQMGAARFEPNVILLEFIFPDPKSSATVLTVRIPAPERIVFLPVPPWVVESIWQGSIEGSHHFESDARKMFSEFERELSDSGNLKWFEHQAPKRRE